MDKFEIFIMIYVLVFFRDIGRLPQKAGIAFYKVVTAFMLFLTMLHIGFLAGVLPWKLYYDMDIAKYNLALNTGFIFLTVIGGIQYMRAKPEQYGAEAMETKITPEMLRQMLGFYRFRKIRTAGWITMTALFIMAKILTDYSLSVSLSVLLGTIAFFMVFFVLYRFKKLFIDRVPAFEDVPQYIIDEWLERECYTDEEQLLLRNRLVKLDLLKEKEPDEEETSGEDNPTT